MSSHNTSVNWNGPSISQQLFLPQEMENIKLVNLRKQRQDLQQKLKLIANRVSFRNSQQQTQIQRYIRSQERSRLLSESKQFKRFQNMLKEEFEQKREFQTIKKAKQVRLFRQSQGHRQQLITQAMRDLKTTESQKIRRLKRLENQRLTSIKQDHQTAAKERYQQALRDRERQKAKQKYYWLVEKRLSFQQGELKEAQIYQRQVEEFQRKINQLQESEQRMRVKAEHASQVLRNAEQNYELLKKA